MANNLIKGRKGGSSSQRTPTEQPDDLQSVAKAKILIALGEGEFAGGLTGKDIYLDGTPLENADGSQNFSGVAWEFRPGTQAQSYIQGIPGTENEINVGTEVSSETAWTHTFTNTQLSAVRVRLKWPSLMKQEDDGDVVGNTVKYAIDLQTDGGAWQTVLETSVSGKTTSGYERSHRIDLPQAGSTWALRLRKVSPDANSARIGDVMTLQSYTEVIDAKLRYPHTALLYIEFDSSQFNGSIPKISCEPRGRIVRVPDNYNPETREYTGTWTGGFKWAWTDNPAWIYYDIVVSDRFGLGDRLTSANISKWALYPIAQYCDQLVPDGRGGDGMEPRYTCNVYVQERNDAYTVLRDFAAIFRGMICWSGEQIIVQADMPRDVDFNYTRANIIGSPRYSSSTSKARYTNALVSWSDPDNAYADAMEPAFIPELVSRYSFNQVEVTAIGCTRQSEAHRKGLWAILTNNKDRMVEIDVGLDGRIPQPGYIIGLGDERLAGRVNGGRISAVNGRVITLDRDIDAKEGDRLHLNLPSGISQARTIQSVNGRRQVTVTTAYSETPEAECVWIVEYTDLVPQQYRVIGVKDNNNGTLTITGVAHDPDKFARIDTGAIIDQRPISVIPPGNQAPPDGILLTSFSVVNQGISVETLQASWDAVQNAIAYEAQWRRNDGNWINVSRSSTTSFEVSGIYAGRYLVRVRAINAAEISSGWAYSEEKTLTGKVGEPLPPLALTTASLTAGIEIRWEFPTGAEDTQRTELQYSPDKSGNGALPLTDLAYPGKQYQQMGLQIATKFWYRARLVDRLSNASPWTGWVQGMSSDNVDDYYQQLDDALKGSDTYEELNKGIQDNSAAADAAQKAADAAKGVAEGAVATNTEQQKHIDEQAKAIAQNVNDINNAAKAGVENANKLAQEILDRQVGDLTTANKAASDVANAIKKAETDDAEVAKKAADNLLNTKSEVEAQISTINTTMQDGFDSLAQQMASISAGTGEQFDSLKIWYFDKSAEGWAEDDANTKLLPVDSDGWVYPSGASSTMRSPNPLAIDGQSYKYMRLRIKRVGNPNWNGKLFWIGINETGWSTQRTLNIPEPEFDPSTGVTVISIPDIAWSTSETVRRLRFDFSTNQTTVNYYMVDWLAVGRPTPGASQAQIQDLKTAMTAADAAEALARSQLAVQLRGNYEGTDPANLVTGLVYNERVARVTAEQAIAADVTTLRTDFNSNKAAVTQRLDTLTSENQAQAQSLTQLQSGLTDANGKIGANSTAINQLRTDVTAIDGRVTANSQLLTGLQSDLNNIHVGGTNLIPNSATLIGVSGVVSGQTYKGNAIKRLAIAAASSAQYDQLEFVLDAPVDGTECVVSFYAKGMNAASTQIYTYLYNPNATVTAVSSQGKKGSWSTGGDGSMIIDLTTDWQRYWVKYTRKAGQTGTQRVIFGRLLKGSVDREVYISSPKFEYGTMPTEWSEAPADNASATAHQALTTRVTAAEGSITTNSQAITQLKGDLSTVQGQLANKAEASALQQLQTTVSQQGQTLASQGSAITDIQNNLQNGKKGYWLLKVFDIKKADGSYIPSLADLNGVPPLSVSEMVDASRLDFLSYGDYKFLYVKALAYVTADKTISLNPGARIADDTARLYINGTSVTTMGPALVKFDIQLKKGWNTIELVTMNWTGQSYLNFGLKISANVDQMFSGAGQLAAASASQVLSSQVEQTAGKVDANSSAITTLSNSVEDINTALNTKADAAALTALTTRVTNAEGKITTQGSAITQLTNDLSAANGKITANANAITGLTTRVTQAEGKLETQGSAITQLTNNLSNTDASIDAAGKIPGNLLANNSFERGQAAFNGWNALSTVMTAQVPHFGKNVLKMASGGNAGIGQDVVITKGRRYRFGVWAKQDSGTVIKDAGNTKFRIADSTGLLIGSNYGPFTSTWQHVSMDWTATKDTTAAFQLTTWLSAGAMYFDDVYVVDITNDTQIQANADAITTLNTKVTQQGNDITSQGNAMTSLTNSLNTLRYANSNPWFDGSLESYANNQQLSGANCFVTESYKLAGNRSLLCRRADGETGNSDKTIGVRTAIRENAVYRFELWAMMPESETPPTGWTTSIGINVQDPSGNNAWNIAVNITEAGLAAGGGRGKWVRFTGKAAMTGGKTRGVVWISTRGASGGPGYSIYLDDVVITDITDANAAQVTADANASAITGLTTRVSNAEGKITSQGDAITKLTNDVSVMDGRVSQKADASAMNALATRVTAAEGSITSQGQAITQLSNSIDAARNTGENLVQNFDFAQGETAYNFQRNTGTAGSMVNIGAFGDGKPGAQMVRVNGTSPGLFANNKKPVPVDGRRKYRYVVKAKGVSGAMNMLLRRWNYNGSTEGSYEDKNNTLTNDWQVITWETNLTPASGVDGVSFGIYCHPANAEIWIDSFRVYDITDEVNIKATTDALQVLTNTVTQQGNQITAQSNALTQLSSSLNNDAAAMATSPGNLLVNPGFERGTALWSGWNNYVDVYAATNPRTGANILRGKTGGVVGLGQNVIGVKKDRTYRFGGYVRRNADMAIGATGNNKFRLGNADTGAGPVSELNFSQSNIATTWTLLTKDWKATADMTVVFSVNFLLTAGEIYFDDVFFVDVTDSLATEGNSTALNSLTTRVTNAEGKITANTTAISNMTSRVGNAEAAIDGLNETTAANGLAMATGFNQMRSMIGDNSAAITTTNKTVTDLEKSTTEQVTTLTSRVGDMSATVQQTASTVADLNGKLGAQWGVKVNTSSGGKNYVAGIQLGIDGSGQSQFLVQADQFGVYVPNGDKSNLVFGVDGNGAYMQQAMARNLVIDFAQITNNIQSTNYVDGSQGWAINKNGGAQFNNAIFRGHVEASSGTFIGRVEAQDGYFNGTVYANRIEGDVGAFAINVVQHRTRVVPKAQWVWFDLLRIRRQGFDQIVNLLGGLLQNDRISISGGGTLRAGMSYAPGSDGGLDPGFLSYAILLRASGATSGGGAMTVALSLDGNVLNQWDTSANIDNYSFIVPAGTGDAVLRYGGYLDRNGSMVITILSRFSAFVARNSNAIGGAQSA